MYQRGLINRNNFVVVTHRDRFFLYEGIAPVMDFSDFLKIKINNSDVIDLVSVMKSFLNTDHWIPYYKNFNRDKALILNFNYDNISTDLTVNKPFVCLLARFRDHDSVRNISRDYLNKIINFLNDMGVIVFVFGKNAEEILMNSMAYYVNLKEACYLMSHYNCKFVFGTLSGATCLGLFCHKKQLLILDPSKYSQDINLKYHPLFMSECINFSGVKIKYFCQNPEEFVLLDFLCKGDIS
jgi:hypothetical protein